VAGPKADHPPVEFSKLEYERAFVVEGLGFPKKSCEGE
jgi:hypothetical protein